MELKTCVHFLLSEEQYAAIKKCGRNLPDQRLLIDNDNNDNSNDNNNEENNNIDEGNIDKSEKIYDVLEYKRLNHIEKMDLIDQSSVLQEQLYQKFKDNKNL